jgi:hypothetical protein
VENGRDLGYFGHEIYQSIIIEIRFDDLPSKENNFAHAWKLCESIVTASSIDAAKPGPGALWMYNGR